MELPGTAAALEMEEDVVLNHVSHVKLGLTFSYASSVFRTCTTVLPRNAVHIDTAAGPLSRKLDAAMQIRSMRTSFFSFSLETTA